MGINELKCLLEVDGSNKAMKSQLRQLDGLRKSFICDIKNKLNCVVRGDQYVVNSDNIEHYSKGGTIRFTLYSVITYGYLTYGELEEYMNGLGERLSGLEVNSIDLYQVSECCGKVTNKRRLSDIRDFVDTGKTDGNWIKTYITIKDPYY